MDKGQKNHSLYACPYVNRLGPAGMSVQCTQTCKTGHQGISRTSVRSTHLSQTVSCLMPFSDLPKADESLLRLPHSCTCLAPHRGLSHTRLRFSRCKATPPT